MSKNIMLVCGCVFAILYIVLYVAGSMTRKAEMAIVEKDKDKFLLPDIFVVGMTVLLMFIMLRR